MPAKVNTSSPNSKPEFKETQGESRTSNADSMSSAKQINTTNFEQTTNETIETSTTMLDTQSHANLPVSVSFPPPPLQPQSGSYVIYPQHHSYCAPTLNVMPYQVHTTLPGQQTLQYEAQVSPACSMTKTYQPQATPYQTLFYPKQPLMGVQYDLQPTASLGQQCLQSPSNMHLYHYQWQQHSPSTTYDTLYQGQGHGFTPIYGYVGIQEPHQEQVRHSQSLKATEMARQDASQINYKQTEYHYRGLSQALSAKPTKTMNKIRKQQEHNNISKTKMIPTTITDEANKITEQLDAEDINNSRTLRKVLKEPTSLSLVSEVPTASKQLTDKSEDGEWNIRESLTSSADSGWVSDNSSSTGKEDGEILEAASLSPTMVIEVTGRFHDSLSLESSASSSSADESYQESQLSSVSSQCPSMSDDNERQHVNVSRKHTQQRIMKQIPHRFMQLLQTAAENAAAQRKRVEGYPLFKYAEFHQKDYTQDQVFYADVPHPEVAGLVPSTSVTPHLGNTSWYYPMSYYAPGQNISQGFMSNDQQASYYEYNSSPHSVPFYVVNVDSPNLVNDNAVHNYNNNNSIYNSNSYEKPAQNFMFFSSPNILSPVPM